MRDRFELFAETIHLNEVCTDRKNLTNIADTSLIYIYQIKI